MLKYVLIIFGSFIIYGHIYKCAKKKKPFKRAFLTMLIGFLVLIAVDIAGIFTGVYLPFSMLSVTISACLGIPGVAGMIVLCWLL
ncbi:MAG: pro-sigmaK processing inhibitor BofA family protein [Ruminococcus sp.]|nr:pro-sigmaK processing inhibitor BofA family protein [Ruminococcus sp.]